MVEPGISVMIPNLVKDLVKDYNTYTNELDKTKANIIHRQRIV